MSIRGFSVALGLGMLLIATSFAPAQEEQRSPFAEGRKLPGDLSDLLRVTDEPDAGRAASGPKAAVPTVADQAKTLARIEEVFDRPKSSAERAKLSGELLVAGSDEKDASTRYVLYRYAGSLALEAKDLKGALAAVDRLERDYDVDALTMKAGVLDRLLARDTAQGVLAAAQQAYGEAIRRDHYDAAERLGSVAYAAARRLKKSELLDELKTRAGQLREMKKALAAIRPAIAMLRRTPDDVDANRQVGEYLCFSKGELSRGLPLLAKGKHELAELERSAPVDADTQQRLGDGWWELAVKHNGPVRDALQHHATGWYRRALPQLKGLTKVKVQKRVDSVASGPMAPPLKVGVLHRITEHGGWAHVAFSPDSRTVVSCSADSTIRLWDVVTGKQKKRFDGHVGTVAAAHFFPDGQRLISGGSDKIVIWDIDSGKPLREFKDLPSKVVRLSLVLPRATRCLTFHADKKVRLWDLQSGRILGSFLVKGHQAGHTIKDISADGRIALSGGIENVVKVWNVQKGRASAFDSRVHCYGGALSHNGRFALTVGGVTMRLWDLRTGQRMQKMSGHKAHVYVATFSPDGHRALSGTSNGSVRLWDLRTGKKLAEFKQNSTPVSNVQIAPNGMYAASADRAGVVCIYGLPSAKPPKK
jgi:hypothetical protein